MASAEWQDKGVVHLRVAIVVSVSVLLVLSIGRRPAIAEPAPTSIDQANLLCNSGETICVAKSLEHSTISAPMEIAVEVNSAQKLYVDWEVRDATGKTLVSGSTHDIDVPTTSTSASSKTLHIKEYVLQPAASREGTLILTPSTFDSSSGKTALPELEIAVELSTETTALTILAPEDMEKYLAEVHASVDSGDEVFGPKTPLVPQSVTVMKTESSGIMGATAEAILLRWPGQGPWRVSDARLEGGVAHVKISSAASEGVSYYATAVSYLIQMSLLRLPGVQRVSIE